MRTLAALALLMSAATAGSTETPAATGGATAPAASVVFASWSPELFARARAEHRYVLLDLAAVWCHWCHVMEETTYRDPRIVRLIGERYLAVRADQDADPELSRRYEDWGWPATIVFAPDGSEIVKRRGYLPPAVMASLLQAIVDDPSPGPSVQPAADWAPSTRLTLDARTRQALERRFVALYDRRHGGWGTVHKLLDAEPLAYALAEPRHQPWARQTLDAALALIDPVAGGMFQYSDAIDWRSPHYEKIMSVQAQAIEMYVAAYLRWHDPRHLQAARDVARYLLDTLSASDGGAFYTSQDADVDAATPGRVYYSLDAAGRQARGGPAIDRHVYPRENGWAIAALAALYTATHEARYRDRAIAAAEWIEQQRRLPGGQGGYRHGDADRAGPYLGDTLAMARAQLALAAIDPRGDEAPWRARALGSLRFIDATFHDRDGGYDSAPVAAGASGVFRRPVRLVDENVEVARLALALDAMAIVAQAMHMLTSPTLLEMRPFSPSLLLLDRQIATTPRR